MAEEIFQPEEDKITNVERAAEQKRYEGLKLQFEARKTLFHDELKAAGQTIAVAQEHIHEYHAKTKIQGYKHDISTYVLTVAEEGRKALSKDKEARTSNEYLSIPLLSIGLKATFDQVKQYVPLFIDAEKARNERNQVEPVIQKFRDLKEFPESYDQESRYRIVTDALNAVENANIPLDGWNRAALPRDVQEIYDNIKVPLDLLEGEIAAYKLDLEVRDHKNSIAPELLSLQDAGEKYNDAEPNLTKLSQLKEELTNQILPLEEIQEKTDALLAISDVEFPRLSSANHALMAIDKIKLSPEYQTYFDILQGKILTQLAEITTLKLYAQTHQAVEACNQDGVVYFTFTPDGKVVPTPAFDQLTDEEKEEYLQYFAKLKLSNGLDLAAALAAPDQQKFFLCKHKYLEGDWQGAKKDLITYCQEEIKRGSDDKENLAEAKDMLKNIAKRELMESMTRLNKMRSSIEKRYDNVMVESRTPYGAFNKEEAKLYLDDMAKVLALAEKIIDKGDALSIEEATKMLRAYDGSDKGIKLNIAEAAEDAAGGAPQIPEKKSKKQLRNEQQWKDDERWLKRWQGRFKSGEGKNQVYLTHFDVLEEQIMLNNPNKEEREEYIFNRGKKMRELGLTDSAKHFFEMYFEKELSETAQKVSRDKVEDLFEFDSSNKERIEKAMADWEEIFKKKTEREPTMDEYRQTEDMLTTHMVDAVYNKEVKKAVDRDFFRKTDKRAMRWKEIYLEGVTLENLGTSFLSDEDWNAAPVFLGGTISLIMLADAVGAVAGIATIEEAVAGKAAQIAGKQFGGTSARKIFQSYGISRLFSGLAGSGLKRTTKEFLIKFAANRARSLGFTVAEESILAGLTGDQSTFKHPVKFLASWALTDSIMRMCRFTGVDNPVGEHYAKVLKRELNPATTISWFAKQATIGDILKQMKLGKKQTKAFYRSPNYMDVLQKAVLPEPLIKVAGKQVGAHATAMAGITVNQAISSAIIEPGKPEDDNKNAKHMIENAIFVVF